ncbi:unnamed protein product [Calypogeia fissa]
MAKYRFAVAWLLLFLATSIHYGHGSNILPAQVGSFQILNNVRDMTILNRVRLVGGTERLDPAYSPIPQGTPYQFQVTEDMVSVTSHFRMVTPTGLLFQLVTDWSTLVGGVPIQCTDCFWVVDDTGFSVASSAQGPLTFVIGWES